MRVVALLLFFLIWLIPPVGVHAISIESDPQYLVMNFSTINELNWAAPEEEWQREIKPQVLAELDAMLAVLPRGTEDRKLAWSTLMEYMNFPMDEPGPTSPYVIKTRRIFEVAAERDLPVLIPLNGFQWWDEVPELYNWWDPDGTNTPASFFNRQDNPSDFKRRFVAGYDPENKWNVDWSDWQTPMKLNWRNWGGGEFRLAPPPNVMRHTRSKMSYRQLMEARYRAIVQQIVASASELEAKGKGRLFAGMVIGTEISLNASATPRDEFMPYGYRALSDYYCAEVTADELIACEERLAKLTKDELQMLRQEILDSYLTELSELAARLGVPKQRLYTHVWGEAGREDPKFAPYAPAAFNPYSRPGVSLYGFAQKPQDSVSWTTALTEMGQQDWAAAEYSLPKDTVGAVEALQNMLEPLHENLQPAKLLVMYNWSEHKETASIPVLAKFLETTLSSEYCQLPEILVNEPYATVEPDVLTWRWINHTTSNVQSATLRLYKGAYVPPDAEPSTTISVTMSEGQVSIPQVAGGVYTWYLEATGCNGAVTTSQPRVVTLPYRLVDDVPEWVKWWLATIPAL